MKPFIVLPTYNESENIAQLIDAIFRYAPEAEIVVVDDNSPDGTWKIAQGISRQNPKVHVVHRTTERGRGTAGIAGFRYSLEHGADLVFEMDADFSHKPAHLPDFLLAAERFDVVSGARFIQGGDDTDRGWVRRLITYFANVYIRTVLGLKLRDCSSGYRCFRAEVLRNMNLDTMVSFGPSIVQETLLRSAQMGYRILEIPIIFKDRRLGTTKLTYKSLINGFVMVWKLRLSKPAPAIKRASDIPAHEDSLR